MKFTGMTRKIDDLGRVVIPKEIRTMLGFEEGEYVEFYTNEGGIFIQLQSDRCVFCGEKTEEIKNGKTTRMKVLGKDICANCLAVISNYVLPISNLDK